MEKDYRDALRRDPCTYCSGPADTLDHIESRARGGGEDGNLTSACRSCNSSKGANHLLAWLLKKQWVAWALRSGADEITMSEIKGACNDVGFPESDPSTRDYERLSVMGWPGW